MRIKLLNIAIVSLVFIFVINKEYCAGADVKNINWVHTYDEGQKLANEKDKNMFVLITAPDWCYYCQLFEKKVLREKEVQDFLNENYVSVLLLDQVDGKRNPDLAKFSFPGFPTAYIYNKSGEMVKDVSFQNSNKVLSLLKIYARRSDDKLIVGKERTEHKSASSELTQKDLKEIDNFMNEWVRK